ncbi:MAG: glycosyltransferase family 4 protein [Bacteroidota bacterium]
MKILMLLERVFPEDERVEKEIASLLDAGHELRIATYSFSESEFEESFSGYTIYRKRISPLMYKFGAAILFLPFYFGFWKRYLDRIYRQWKFDAIHIHDLPLAKLGVAYKKKYGVRFVADQHELYSSWIVKNAHYNTLIGKLVSMLSNWDAYERNSLRQADLVCTVEEPLRAIYLDKYGLDPEKIIVIPNTPLRTMYQVASKQEAREGYNLFYCGGMDILRGLDTVIRALPLLREDIPEIRLILVGRKSKHFDPMVLADSLGVGDLLDFRGWVDYRELPHEIDRSDLCFFTPPADREEIHNTIATKIYQYMARGKPVIVGSARYMKTFVEKYKIGLTVDEQQPESFADAIRKLYRNPALSGQMSDNALKVINTFYWEETIKELVAYYRDSED